MSAEQARTLPVVACEIVPQFTFAGFNTPPQVATVQNDSGVWIAAVAVPWALFHDSEFRIAVAERFMDAMRGQRTGFVPFDVTDAIAAELRARVQP